MVKKYFLNKKKVSNTLLLFTLIFTLFLKPINSYASGYENQKKAMSHISDLTKAISDTDYDMVLYNLKKLYFIDYTQCSDPFSLLTDIIKSLPPDRILFLPLTAKYIKSQIICKIAQQVLITVVQNKRYVGNQSKQELLELIKLSIEVQDLHKEPCLGLITNLEFVKNVVNALPENKSELKEGLLLTYNICKLCYDKDIEGVYQELKKIYKIGKNIYKAREVDQISLLWTHGKQFFKTKDKFHLDKMIEIHENTIYSAVRCEAIKIFNKLLTEYYNKAYKDLLSPEEAYKMYNILIKWAFNKDANFVKKNFRESYFAIEGLISIRCGLINQNNEVAKQSAKYIERNLEILQEKEFEKLQKNVRKILNKLSLSKHTTKILTLINNSSTVIDLINSNKMLSDFNYELESDKMDLVLQNQEKILSKLYQTQN